MRKMANKYCNLNGSRKIKDEYQKINIGFDKVEEDVNNIDTRVNNIITTPAEGISAQEIIDARGGRPVLGKRFEDIETDIEDLEVDLAAHKAQTAIEQVDYVELLKRSNNFTKMQLYKVHSHGAEVSVYNDSEHITFEFMRNNDEYMVQSRIWTGGYTLLFQPYLTVLYSDLIRSGSWVDSSASVNGYTQQVGATWEATVQVEKDGDSIYLHTHSSDRGGIFKITLDENENTAKTVSTYGTGEKKKIELYRNLDKGVYKIKGEFMGDDPQNPPSTSPSRGWLNSLNYPTLTAEREFIYPEKDKILTTPSNKEFAYSIKPFGGTEFQFVPFHGIPTAFEAESAKFKNNGDVIDFSNMASGQYAEIDMFMLEQHIYGRHPESGDTNLVEIWTTHTITKDGVLSVDGKLKVLEPVTIIGSYVIMGVAKGDLFDKCVTSFGNQFLNTPEMQGTNTFLLEEGDLAKSYCFLSSINKNLAIAFRYNNIKETLRQSMPNKNALDAMAYLQHRSNDVLKLYNRLWDNTGQELEPGFTHRFSGDYVISVQKNAYDLLTI